MSWVFLGNADQFFQDDGDGQHHQGNGDILRQDFQPSLNVLDYQILMLSIKAFINTAQHKYMFFYVSNLINCGSKYNASYDRYQDQRYGLMTNQVMTKINTDSTQWFVDL